MEFTGFDNDLLNILQKEFPLTETPFMDIADRLGASEEDVLMRVQRMKEDGLIRRIGAVFDSRAMGYYSILCACEVAEDRMESVALAINRLSGVTHNYVRQHHYNIWFTLTAVNQQAARDMIHQLEQENQIQVIMMPATKVYKINAAFEIGDQHE